MYDQSWSFKKSSTQQQQNKHNNDDQQSSLTKTGKMALGSQNQNSNLQQYSQFQSQNLGQMQKINPDMDNQLRLIKQKMTQQQTYYNDIDHETQNLNNQLNNLNNRLQNKQYQQNSLQNNDNQSFHNGSSVPRNRQINNQYQIKQQYNNIQSEYANSQNSTNISQNLIISNKNYQFGQQQSQQTHSTNPDKYLNNTNQQLDLYTRINNKFIQHQNKQDQQSRYEPTIMGFSSQQNKLQNQNIFVQEIPRQQQNSQKQNHQTTNQHYINQEPQVHQPQITSQADKGQRNIHQEYNDIQQRKNYEYQQYEQPINQQKISIKQTYNINNPKLIDEIPAVAKQKPLLPDRVGDENLELTECPEGCGRSFNMEAMDKHKKICKQVFQSKRKQFNSKQHRIVEQEQIKLEKQGQAKERLMQKKQQIKKESGKDAKWKQQSEQFRQMISQIKSGNEVVTPNPIQNDYTECPHCNRKFNESAAQRHIPGCQQRQQKNQFRK